MENNFPRSHMNTLKSEERLPQLEKWDHPRTTWMHDSFSGVSHFYFSTSCLFCRLTCVPLVTHFSLCPFTDVVNTPTSQFGLKQTWVSMSSFPCFTSTCNEVYKVFSDIKRSVSPECILRNTCVRVDKASVKHGFKCESQSAIKRQRLCGWSVWL